MGHSDSRNSPVPWQTMKRPLFALIDCNNFFVSCERLFRPDLKDKPAVVLSSNDGCVVARSNEVKALGIPMAAPAFKYKDIFRQHGVAQFSANFELYGDISRRITEVLTTITPRIEIYSVDESFLDLSELKIPDYEAWGKMVRDAISQWVGVPVSVGIAPTKTLAKLACEYAKKHQETAGVVLLSPQDSHILQAVDIKDVWGVGRRLAPKMRAEGIMNALDLSRMRSRHIQQLRGIPGRQLVAELGGTSCYPLERGGKRRQSIARTRTFGEDINNIGAIQSALATFAGKAAFRLRESGQLTQRMGVFAQTNKHKPGFQTWKNEAYFETPTADTGLLMGKAMELFENFYNATRSYHRAGIYLWDFLPANQVQTDLFGVVKPLEEAKSWSRMQAVDSLNERFGRKTISYAAEELGKAWKPKYQLRSPRYTTNLAELPSVRPI